MSREDEFDEIAEAIQKEYARAQVNARVPPAEVVWMRARLRAREEAARKAMRPILIGQAVGIAACVGLLVAIAGRLSFAALQQLPLALVEVVVGSWLVLTPLAVYLALSRD